MLWSWHPGPFSICSSAISGTVQGRWSMGGPLGRVQGHGLHQTYPGLRHRAGKDPGQREHLPLREESEFRCGRTRQDKGRGRGPLPLISKAHCSMVACKAFGTSHGQPRPVTQRRPRGPSLLGGLHGVADLGLTDARIISHRGEVVHGGDLCRPDAIGHGAQHLARGGVLDHFPHALDNDDIADL